MKKLLKRKNLGERSEFGSDESQLKFFPYLSNGHSRTVTVSSSKEFFRRILPLKYTFNYKPFEVFPENDVYIHRIMELGGQITIQKEMMSRFHV